MQFTKYWQHPIFYLRYSNFRQIITVYITLQEFCSVILHCKISITSNKRACDIILLKLAQLHHTQTPPFLSPTSSANSNITSKVKAYLYYLHGTYQTKQDYMHFWFMSLRVNKKNTVRYDNTQKKKTSTARVTWHEQRSFIDHRHWVLQHARK